MCISRLWCAVRVLLGICLLSSLTVPLADAQPNQGLERSEALRCASIGNAVPSGLVVLLPSGEIKLSIPESASFEESLHERRRGADQLARHRAGRGNPGLGATGRAVRRRGIVEKMGTSHHVPGLFLSGVGAGRRSDRSVQNPIRAWQGDSREAPDAMGSVLPRSLVRIHETGERKVRPVIRIQNDSGRRANLGFRGDDLAELATGSSAVAQRLLYACQISGRVGRGLSLLRGRVSQSVHFFGFTGSPDSWARGKKGSSRASAREGRNGQPGNARSRKPAGDSVERSPRRARQGRSA